MATKFICVLFIFLVLLQGFSCQLLLTPRKVKVEVFFSPVNRKLFGVMGVLEKILKTDLGRFIDVEVNNVPNCELHKETKVHCHSYSETREREAFLIVEQLCAYYSLIDARRYCGQGVPQHRRLQRYTLQGIRYIICTSDKNYEAVQNVNRCGKKIPIVAKEVGECRKRHARKEVLRAFARHERVCLEDPPFIVLNNMWDERQHRNMRYLGYFICDLLFHVHEVCKRKFNRKPKSMLSMDDVDDSSSTSVLMQTNTRLGYLLGTTLTILFLR